MHRLARLSALLLLVGCREPAPPPPPAAEPPPAPVTRLRLVTGAAPGTRAAELRLETFAAPAQEAEALVKPEELPALRDHRLAEPALAGQPLARAALRPPQPQRERVPEEGRAMSVRLLGAGQLRPGDHVDLLGYLSEPANQDSMALTVVQDAEVLSVGAPGPGGRPVGLALPTRYPDLLVPSPEYAALAQALGPLRPALRAPGDQAWEERGRATLETLKASGRADSARRRAAWKAPAPDAAPEARVPAPGRLVEVEAEGAEFLQVGAQVDVLGVGSDRETHEPWALKALQAVWVASLGEPELGPGGRVVRPVGLLVQGREAELLHYLASGGRLFLAERDPAEPLEEHVEPATLTSLITGERIVLHNRHGIIPAK